jgi:hypothetical protein
LQLQRVVGLGGKNELSPEEDEEEEEVPLFGNVPAFLSAASLFHFVRAAFHSCDGNAWQCILQAGQLCALPSHTKQ